MKKLNFIILATAMLFLASCNNKEDRATGAGDVLIVAKKSGTKTVYGIAIYAYTFGSFKSVTAVNNAATDKIYTLKPNQGYKTNFYYETPDAEFLPTQPAAATFNFTATFENGATDEFDDILTDKALTLPGIETCEYNVAKKELQMSWTQVANADSYSVNISDGSNLVFVSDELSNSAATFSITTSTRGWASGFKPVSGKSYTVRLFAFLYEPGGNSYNVQASAVSETTATWGD